jgi:O-antigen/teichoic acid export membrane protein
MQKKFIENLIFLIFINLLIKPFWIFGIDRTIQVAVGDVEYGLYFSLFNFSFIFQIILDFGITNFNNRNISQHSQLMGKYFSSIITFKLLLTLVYLLILFSTGFIIGYSQRAIHFLLFLAINQVLASYILYLRSNISAVQQFKLDGLFSVMDRIFMIILCSMALWGNFFKGHFRIEWYVYIQTISYSITVIIAFLTVYHKAGYVRFTFNRSFFIVIVKNTWPFAVLALLMSVYNRIDGVMIERLLRGNTGRFEAGIYAQGYRILDAFNMFAFLFATLLLPIFSKMLKQKENVVDMVRTSYSLFFFPAFFLVITCFFYRAEFMNLLYHQTSEYNYNVFGLLMINFLATGSVYIFGTLLTANGNLRFLNSISAVGVVLNIALNFFLIQKFHALGAAISTLITQFLLSGWQLIRACNLFKIRISVSYLLKSAFFILLLIGVFYWLKRTDIQWYYEICIATIIGATCILSLRLMRFKTFYKEIQIPG